MAAFLFDVNVLVALAWRNHEHHQAALNWWAGKSSDTWASCPMTQCGFVRISCNPKIMPGAKTAKEALKLLEGVMAMPRHVFWEDDFMLTDVRFVNQKRIQGYRQIMDTYLLGLSMKRGGKFATFDAGVPSLTAKQDAVVLIPK